MEQPIPIETIHLFPEVDRQLIELLQSLTPEEWQSPTIARLWTVKDIAAHMLDTTLRTISFSRDGFISPPPTNPINSYQDLVQYLNHLNAEWVNAMKRVSPQIITEQLAIALPQFYECVKDLSPFDKAIYPVAWAGEEASYNWFHLAREYTEKFVHQLQIRDAVKKPDLMTKELFHPFIDTLLYALPHTYRDIEAATGTAIKITITTEVGGDWFLTKAEDNWLLTKKPKENISASISLDPIIAWKLFSKGINAAAALQTAELSGNIALAKVALTAIAVMA